MEQYSIETKLGISIPLQQVEGEDIMIVEHAEIMRIIRERKILYEFSPKDPVITPVGDGMEIIYHVTMRDPETGLSAVAVGESNPTNLETDIAKKYPAIIASNRAIDRAMIQILGISSKAYSDLEVQVMYQNARASCKNENGYSPETDSGIFDQDDGYIHLPDEEYHPCAEGLPASGMENENAEAPLLADDEKLLVGNCKGERYGAIKNTAKWKSFLNWVKSHPNANYNNDSGQQEQFERIRKLVEGGKF